MSDIVRTTVEENDANIIKNQVMNVLDDNLIRHQVRGLEQPAPEPPVLETLNVTENGTYTPEEGVDGFDEVNVNVELHGDTAYDLKDAPSGSISTFTDGVDLPLNKLVVGIVDDTNRSYFQGLLNGTYGFVDLGSLTWTYAGNGIFTSDTMIGSYGRGTEGLCLRYTNSGTVSSSDMPDKTYQIISTNMYSIWIRDNSYDSSATFTQSLDGVYLIYELETPTTPTITNAEYQMLLNAFGVGYDKCVVTVTDNDEVTNTYTANFPSGVTISNGSIDILNGVLTDDDLSEEYNITPIAIRSLEGVNNVFADTGDIEELEYFYDVTTEIKDEVIAFLDFNENYTESRDVFYDKINGTPSVQSHRSITYDTDGNMIFDNTNGYLWIAQYLGFNKVYKIEIDIVGKTSYVADDGTNIFKFNLGNNHVICTWDADNSNWKMQDWTGHDTRLNEDFDFFNGKKLDIFFNASYVNGVLTKNANNTLTMYVGTTLVYAWEQSASLTGDDNIACIGLGHNSACKDFAFKSVKITKLNNLEV